MKRIFLTMTFVLAAMVLVVQAAVKPIELTGEWTRKIQDLAPVKPTADVAQPRRALLFSRMTGYKHWVTPHTAAVIKAITKKTGTCEIVESDDVAMFAPETIGQFDVIILNNNCSDRKKRDLFFDVTRDEARAAALEKSLIAHIESGKGLVVLHGAITMQNNSPAFSRMVGGSFDFHPAQQEVVCAPVDPKHPLVAAFAGKPLVHIDEPYLFKNAYKDKDFRPLLVMDTSKLNCGKKTEQVRSDVRYVAWIKKHGKGRVFYCSPAHNAQSFEKPELLRFILDGIQYAAGDLECDDTPLK